MATYGNLVITTLGQQMYADAIAGTAMTFTRLQIGGGQLAASATLAAALTSGTAYTSLSVAALAGALANGSTLVIGTGVTTQTVTVSAYAASGATTIDVTSFTANAAYAIGAAVAITQNEAGLSALADPIAYININSFSESGTTAQINALYQNTALAASTYTCEIGLLASNATLGEVLYAYANAGTNGDTIPPYSDGPFSRQFQINTAIGSATNITATIPTDPYILASAAGVANGIATLNASGELTESQLPIATTTTVGGVSVGSGLSITTAGALSATTQTVPVATTTTAGTVEISAAPASGNPIAITTADTTYTAPNAAQLGGIPAADYIRGDAGAPNPQMILTPVWYSEGVQGIAIVPNMGYGPTVADTYGPSVMLGWNISGGAGELDIVGASSLPGDILRVYGLSGSASPYTLSAKLFGVDRSGNASIAGAITAASGDITGALTAASVNGTVPLRVFYSVATTLAPNTGQTVTVPGFSTSNQQYVALGIIVADVGYAGGTIIGAPPYASVVNPAAGFQIANVTRASGSISFILTNTSGNTWSNYIFVSGVAL